MRELQLQKRVLSLAVSPLELQLRERVLSLAA
jgi:hypothetical protein